MKILIKSLINILRELKRILTHLTGIIIFKMNKIKYDNVSFNGLPYVSIQGECIIGSNFRINSILGANPIGRNSKSSLVVRNEATLIIGNNVGMSGTTIVCQKKIVIGDNVKMGGNVCIYDTDFHAINSTQRKEPHKDSQNTRRKDIYIADDVFIGAHSTILKGVSIGKNAVIGACSVVTKNVPENEIWAGNPAKYIKTISIT